MAYIQSREYRARFRFNAGKCLFITTSQRRLASVLTKIAAAKLPHMGWFFFTTAEAITAQTVLTKPIWYQVGVPHPVVIFRPASPLPVSPRQMP